MIWIRPQLLARNVALEDELSQRPPLEELKRLQAEKKEVDWLFASSNRLNEKCMAKEQRCVSLFLSLSTFNTN